MILQWHHREVIEVVSVFQEKPLVSVFGEDTDEVHVEIFKFIDVSVKVQRENTTTNLLRLLETVLVGEP